MSLSKLNVEGVLWTTEDFSLEVNDTEAGYRVVNRNTGQVELYADQETLGVLRMLALQEQYSETMDDPEREFGRMKSERIMQRSQKGGSILS